MSDLDKIHSLTFKNFEKVKKALAEGKKARCMCCGSEVKKAVSLGPEPTAICEACGIDCVLTEDDAPEIKDNEWSREFNARYFGESVTLLNWWRGGDIE